MCCFLSFLSQVFNIVLWPLHFAHVFCTCKTVMSVFLCMLALLRLVICFYFLLFDSFTSLFLWLLCYSDQSRLNKILFYRLTCYYLFIKLCNYRFSNEYTSYFHVCCLWYKSLTLLDIPTYINSCCADLSNKYVLVYLNLSL